MAENRDENARVVLERMLLNCNRKLTDTQWNYVMEQVSYEPTPLYLILAARIVSTWHNDAPSDVTVIRPTVAGIINQILDDIEVEYGKLFTRATLGFITLSSHGISDDEMQDLISLDDDILHAIFQYSQLPTKRLPLHTWLRLKQALDGLITETDYKCTCWYYRQIQSVCYERLLVHERSKFYTIMGQYFGNLIDSNRINTRLISRQPLTVNGVAPWYPTAIINVRRVLEASDNLIAADLLDYAIDELCSINSVCCFIKIGEGYQLIRKLKYIINKFLSFQPWSTINESKKEKCHHYLHWLQQEMTSLMIDPSSQIPATATAEPVISYVRNDMMTYLKHTNEYRCQVSPSSSVWYRPRSMGLKSNYSYLICYLIGHRHGIHSVDYSRIDPKICASASGDTTIRLWDVDTFEEIGKLQGHTDRVRCIAFHPILPLVVSGSNDKTIRIWDTSSQTFVGHLKEHSSTVIAMVFHPSGAILVSTGFDNMIICWQFSSTTSCKPLYSVSVPNSINSIRFDHSGSKLVTGDTLWNVSIWKVNTLTLVITQENHLAQLDDAEKAEWLHTQATDSCVDFDHMCPVAYNPCIPTTIATAKQCTITLWDTVTTKVKHLLGHTSFINAVLYTTNGKRLVSASHHYPLREDDASIRVWNSESGELLLKLFGGTDGVTSICFNSFNYLITTSWDSKVKVYDGQTWENITKAEVIVEEKHTSWCCQVRISPDGKFLASASNDTTIKIWNVIDGSEHLCLRGHLGRVTSVSWNRDSTCVASASKDCSVIIWDIIHGGSIINSFTCHAAMIRGMHWSAGNNKLIATGSYDNHAKVTNCDSNETVADLVGHSDYVMSVMLHINNTHLATASKDSTVRIWDITSMDVIHVLTCHSDMVWEVMYSLDCSLLASASQDKTVIVYDTVNYSTIAVLPHDENANCCCFSNDNRLLFTGSSDMLISLWDLTTFSRIAAVCGHEHSVDSLEISKDGYLLASGSEDTTVKLWDMVREFSL